MIKTEFIFYTCGCSDVEQPTMRFSYNSELASYTKSSCWNPDW